MLHLKDYYFPTLKEVPAEAEIVSHKLLLRAGMIRKQGSGVYTFLPLGHRVLSKVQEIIREEMDAVGAQEVLMPILQPSELWHQSGRWNDYGPELMRFNDRHDHAYCLGPTHEELISDLVRDELRSYKQLPVCLYQMQVKFRDEIRPRFGLLRTREFIMKDAYSFHASQESLQETYDKMAIAYSRICERLGLDYRMVEADSGQIGGSVTCEFMALANAGESDLVDCSCGYAADAEAAKVVLEIPEAEVSELTKIETPNVHTISELAAFLGIEENATVKALAGTGDDEKTYAIFIPGDHELNDLKVENIINGFRFFTDEELREHKLVKGSMGPVDLPDDTIVVADESLKNSPAWIVGANEDGFHYTGAACGRDFNVDIWADLVLAKEGDICPNCGKKLSGDRGIEVSQIFQLGTKYSDAMNATYMAQDGSEQPYIMGCYGIGVTRSMAAVVEQRNDEHGIAWPVSIAPAEVIVLPLQTDVDKVMSTAACLAEKLEERGVSVAIDDRDARAGVKFADADLIGWPYQLVCGKRGIENGTLEFKDRASGEKTELELDNIVEEIVNIVVKARKELEPKS